MGSFMPEDVGAEMSGHLFPGPVEFVVFSTLPTPAGSSTDGVEGAPRKPFSLSAVATGTGARITQQLGVGDFTVTGLLVPSSELQGCAIALVSTGQLRLVNEDWRPSRLDIPAGGDLFIDALDIATFTTRV